MTSWKEVQGKLKQLGFYDGQIDGDRGPLTDKAIIEFKKSIGFAPTSFFGPLTEEALLGSSFSSDETPWMNEALTIKGMHEKTNNKSLRAWFDKSVSWIDPREIPWCGAFVATCFRKWKPEIQLPENPLGARNWNKFGIPSPPLRGSILTFWRGSRTGWQGHVGFYFGEDDSAYHVLGGNQSDAVTITRIAKSRLLESRWPKGIDVSGKKTLLTSSGKLSVNEA